MGFPLWIGIQAERESVEFGYMFHANNIHMTGVEFSKGINIIIDIFINKLSIYFNS